eukprot:NODE_795_length_1773_cov_4.887471_g650_i0.p1 GENE.NODE_795_length_1773_cov_4.887471_g650_i0~~NODE_795_length_1773_cov_4.887471_g650_i0.p1  ORF type:complete len:72 (+),score=3.10 NODE_795_length_1773_cov_4.887471_g650_i0:908-1123(+)
MHTRAADLTFGQIWQVRSGLAAGAGQLQLASSSWSGPAGAVQLALPARALQCALPEQGLFRPCSGRHTAGP